MSKLHVLLFCILFAAFLFIRLFHLPAWIHISGDQGLHLLDMHEIYTTKKITLIGPPSSLSYNGRNFYSGSIPYYLMIPVLLISSWNPVSISYFLIALNFISTCMLIFTLVYVKKKLVLAYFCLTLLTFTPFLIQYSRFLWFPNFLVPISTIIVTLLLLLDPHKRNNNFILLATGFLLGFGLQFHYSFLLAFIVVLIWVFIVLKRFHQEIILLIIGSVAGFGPLLLFEFRHNFYNIRTIYLYLTSAKETANMHFQSYYLLSIASFLVFAVSLFLTRFYQKQKIFTGIALIFLIAYSLSLFFKKPRQGFLMVDDFDYESFLKMTDIIVSENTENYNIVDILTGDSRALALRYFLTIRNHKPEDFLSYPKANYLFIYTRIPIEKVLAGSMWEIDSIKPAKVLKKWVIKEDINLYLLQKEK